MANPVRIYVLHHPRSDPARLLAGRIYEWFRLPSLEGIPVYVRSDPAGGQSIPRDIEVTEGVLNYLLPLVDAYMVRDMVWQEYLTGLARRCDEITRGAAEKRATCLAGSAGMVMFPVALDGTASNLPAPVSRRNFIRHGAGSAPEELAATAEEETLKHLTEALGRDLNGRLFPAQAGHKLRVFISYARADGAEIPKRIRDYIQSRTQCAAFFDENDIGYGTGFGAVLEDDVGEQARALIVVRGDNYADRPWCRWELSRYLRPRRVAIESGNPSPAMSQTTLDEDCIGMFHPLLVVDSLQNGRLTREIPELGHAPSLRWAAGREQLCFSMLMREVLFGSRNVLAARQMAGGARKESQRQAANDRQLWLNRMPGPLVMQQVLSGPPLGEGGGTIVNYGGNGLPMMELRLLEHAFPQVRFRAFNDFLDGLPKRMGHVCFDSGTAAPLARRVIVISSSPSKDLASLGYLDAHLRETLIYLLRPLISLGADVMYAGAPPKPGLEGCRDASNITMTLLGLISDERKAEPGDNRQDGWKGHVEGRLFHPSQWPLCERISAEDEASWINLCSVRRIIAGDAGLEACQDESNLPKGEQSARFLATVALINSHGRKQMAEGFQCPVPGNVNRKVEPAAFVLVGGKLEGFSGLMPGIFEEFLYAMKLQRPVFLLGGLGGAAGLLAKALLAPASERRERPPQFTWKYYARNHACPNYVRLLDGIKQLKPARPKDRIWLNAEESFAELWKQIQEARRHWQDPISPLNNHLSADDNRTLLTTDNTTKAVQLIWQGLDDLFMGDMGAYQQKAPPRTGSTRRR